MSKFEKFEDDDEQHASGNNTKSMFEVKEPSPDYSREFRNETLDEKFRNDPVRTWLKMLFPHFELFSLTTLYILILIVVFIIQLLVWLTSRWTCVTYHMGANYTPAIHRWQIHRLVFPTFVHNDFPHLGWNVFVLFAVGMNAEHYLGTVGYVVLIAASALLGNIFTAGFRHNLCNQSVGASTVIMGIIGFEFLWFAFNWHKMRSSKWLYVLYICTIFLTTVMGTWASGHVVEFWGHLGGLIAGVCITCIFFTELQNIDLVRVARPGFFVFLALAFFLAFMVMVFRDTSLCFPNLCNSKYYKIFE
ncbi:unnamed protein product [Moneuplotes crassus]|uniref:Peptidase S54 rhomboid domain-containing protein n=1 Tax=Euplotes crassus TaxID=5936 RepID=A0AAD2D0S9_EUPCR|nr:unnamed protein product [Moneuplotes crassus]